MTVLLYTWFSYSARNPGIYFVAMNYSVHAVMYSYYFLMEIKLWPRWFKYVSFPSSHPPSLYIPLLNCVISSHEDLPSPLSPSFPPSLPPSLPPSQPHVDHHGTNIADARRGRHNHRHFPLCPRPFLWSRPAYDSLVCGDVRDLPVLLRLVFRGAILAVDFDFFFFFFFFFFGVVVVTKREGGGRGEKEWDGDSACGWRDGKGYSHEGRKVEERRIA